MNNLQEKFEDRIDNIAQKVVVLEIRLDHKEEGMLEFKEQLKEQKRALMKIDHTLAQIKYLVGGAIAFYMLITSTGGFDVLAAFFGG